MKRRRRSTPLSEADKVLIFIAVMIFGPVVLVALTITILELTTQ